MRLPLRTSIALSLTAALLAAACTPPRDSGPGPGKVTPSPQPAVTGTPTAPTPTPSASGTPSGGGLQAPAMDPRVANAYTGFGLDLFKQLAAKEQGKNVFISPSSVAFALSMTYNGAAGTTQEEMAKVLAVQGLSLKEVNDANAAWKQWLSNPGKGVELSIANSLWVRQGIQPLPDFIERNQKSYDAEVSALDFSSPEAAPTINDWVSDNTKGKIPDIVASPIDPQTILFLINAIYFNGKWAKPFDPKRTMDGAFTRADGSTVTVPMMSQDGTFPLYQGSGFQAAALPYGDGRMRMYFFLPDEGTSAGSLVQGLNQKDWDTWMKGFQDSRAVVTIPRFEMDYEATLNDALKAMGMPTAFDPGRADLTQMVSRESVGGQNAFISNVKHKTYLKVTEEGTEAAGATSVEVGITSMPPSFTLDRPFVTAIVDSATGTILFLGVIADPTA